VLDKRLLAFVIKVLKALFLKYLALVMNTSSTYFDPFESNNDNDPLARLYQLQVERANKQDKTWIITLTVVSLLVVIAIIIAIVMYFKNKEARRKENGN
jgi:type IV secretory pathway component VirB8